MWMLSIALADDPEHPQLFVSRTRTPLEEFKAMFDNVVEYRWHDGHGWCGGSPGAGRYCYASSGPAYVVSA